MAKENVAQTGNNAETNQGLKEKLLKAAATLPNLYFTDNEAGKVSEWYFNAGSQAGGSFVNNTISTDKILEISAQITNPEEFFKMFESLSKQTEIDINNNEFETALEELQTAFADNICTFSSYNEDSIIADNLIGFAEDYETRLETELKPGLINEILENLKLGEPEDYGYDKGLKEIENVLSKKSYAELKNDLESFNQNDFEEAYFPETENDYGCEM